MKKDKGRTTAETTGKASVRALPGGYLAGLLVVSFIACLIAYLDYLTAALILGLIAWTVIPLLWFTDRIVFDGRRIARTGIVYRLTARAVPLPNNSLSSCRHGRSGRAASPTRSVMSHSHSVVVLLLVWQLGCVFR